MDGTPGARCSIPSTMSMVDIWVSILLILCICENLDWTNGLAGLGVWACHAIVKRSVVDEMLHIKPITLEIPLANIVQTFTETKLKGMAVSTDGSVFIRNSDKQVQNFPQPFKNIFRIKTYT